MLPQVLCLLCASLVGDAAPHLQCGRRLAHAKPRAPYATMQQPIPASPISALTAASEDGSVLLTAEGLSQTYDGDTFQFRDVGLTVARGAKLGLVGDNGCGKSTLLKVLAGVLPPERGGKVTLRKHTRLVYVEQEPMLPPGALAEDFIFASDAPAVAAARAFREAAAKAEEAAVGVEEQPHGGEAAAAAKAAQASLARATDRMEASGGWRLQQEVEEVTRRMGVEHLMKRSAESLSGGERKRMALAGALLQSPELLLLDEPTNHLDIDVIRLLEELVSASDITLLVVTHDRAFLGSVCDSILELGRGVLYRHRTNFDGFLEARAARLEAQEAADAADRNTLRREAAWARKQPKARESKSKSRMQEYDNLASRVAAAPRDAVSLEIAAKGMSRLGTSVATFDSVSVRFGDGYIIRDFSYDFSRGERIGVVGPNGAGKSTFLKALQGMLPLSAGAIKVGETVRFGHYEQEQLAPAGNARVLDFVREAVVQAAGGDGTPADHLREAQQLLRKFIFSQPIADLSGGERRRLQLLSTLADKPNFLMLDEPTNDLDFSIMTVLEDYIATYPGVLLLVSHDRAFVDSLVDTLFILPADGSGHIKIWQGSPGSAFSDYLAWRDAEATAAVAEEKRSAAAAAALPVNGGAAAPLGQIDILVAKGGVAASGTSQPGPKVAADKARRALSQFEVEQLARIEGEMEQLSAKQKTLQSKIDGFDPGRNGYDELTGWSDEIERLKGTLETKEEKWLELSERL